jgi:hypothetical protein
VTTPKRERLIALCAIANSDRAKSHTQLLFEGLNLPKPQRDPVTQYLRCFLVAAREGIQPYPNRGQEGEIHYRNNDFVQALAQGIVYQPLVDGHHTVTTTQNTHLKVGLIVGQEVRGALLILEAVIEDETLIRRILSEDDDELGISLAYGANIIPEIGTWTDKEGIAGIPNTEYSYTHRQEDPETEHCAVVPMGRGGPLLKIADECDTPDPEHLSETEMTTAKPKMEDMGALCDRLKTLEDAVEKMSQMKQEDMGPSMMDTLNDTINTIQQTSAAIRQAIQTAYYGQDRSLKGEVDNIPALERAAGTGANTVPHLRDSGAEVGRLVELWLSNKDVLCDSGLEFSASEADLLEAVLNSGKAKLADGLSEDADTRLKELRASYRIYSQLKDNADFKVEKRKSGPQKLFDSFEGATPAVEPIPAATPEVKPAKEELKDSFDFGDAGAVQIKRSENGTVTYL